MRHILRPPAALGAVALGAALLVLPTGTATAASWPLPTSAPPTGAYADNPDVAIGPDGTIVLAADVYDETTHLSHVVTSSRPPRGTWSAPVKLGSGSSNRSTEPDIAIGPDGTTTIAWRDEVSEDDWVVMASTRPPGGTWSTPQPLSVVGVDEYVAGHDNPEVSVAAATDGSVSAIWPQWVVDHFEIQSAVRSAAGLWSAPQTLGVDNWTARKPAIAAGPDGSVIAAWAGGSTTDTGTRLVVRQGAGPWSAPVRIGDGLYGAPTIAFAPDGTAGVVWANGYGKPTITTRSPGGAWATPTVISPIPVNDEELELAAGAGPTFHAVWTSDEAGDYDQEHVYAATGSPGGQWLYQAIAAATSGSPKLAIESDGTAVAMWLWRPPGSYGSSDIQASVKTPGGIWESPSTVRDVADDVYTYQVALATGPAGSLVALWNESDEDGAGTTYAVIEDPAAPDTGVITGPKRITPKKKARFAFTGPAGATYECRVDTTLKQQHGITGTTKKARKKSKKKGKQPVPWRACTSPYVVNAKALRLTSGKHTVYVRAEQYGVADPTPSALKVRVKR
ncbi:hypothetical protein [Nocardioides sp.]|uniref:hypothetical protein n=1 Tax=Nocardioides sp. TaxID=35761 RepID=UPI0039E575ED